MKKVKIALSAIAVIAVVGGALAFKARVGNTVFVHDPLDTGNPNRCTKLIAGTLVDDGSAKLQITRASITTAAVCPVVQIYQGE